MTRKEAPTHNTAVAANVDALLNRSGPKDGDPVVGRPELKFREFEATYDADNDGVWASDKVFLPRAAILNMMVVLMQNAPTERPHPETIRETWVNDNAAETSQQKGRIAWTQFGHR